MKLCRLAIVAVFAAGGVTSAAQAGHSHGYNVYQPTPGVHTLSLTDQTTNGTYYVIRKGDTSGMATIVYANSLAIKVDPHVPYHGGPIGGLDQNHSLLRAQRLYNALHAAPTRVIRHARQAADEDTQARGLDNIEPRVIIEVPERFRRPQQQPEPKAPQTDDEPRQVASAD